MTFDQVLWDVSYRNVSLYSLAIPKPKPASDSNNKGGKMSFSQLATMAGVKPNANSKR